MMPDTEAEPTQFQVSASARLQVMRLTARERQRLAHILSSPQVDADTRKTNAGHFLTRLSPIKRVLWTKGDGHPTVLSIADRTYRTGP